MKTTSMHHDSQFPYISIQTTKSIDCHTVVFKSIVRHNDMIQGRSRLSQNIILKSRKFAMFISDIVKIISLFMPSCKFQFNLKHYKIFIILHFSSSSLLSQKTKSLQTLICSRLEYEQSLSNEIKLIWF